ncbi:MAG: sodium:solute symporter [Paludibacteraceae bacterium]|nr:sodium:solute symporter [Paludibacteraceae bacterium]
MHYLCTSFYDIFSLMIFILIAYILLILAVAFYKRQGGNDVFFTAEKNSSWAMVAFGMLGASLSGISFISVPGMAPSSGFTYMQLVLGFSLGYIIVAKVLLPLYYKLNLTNIYEYLSLRHGKYSYRTASMFFILSRGLGSAARLYVSAFLIHTFIFAPLGIPFPLVAILMVTFIYLYTSVGGIHTLIKTDVIQTIFLLGALIILLLLSYNRLGESFSLSETLSQQSFIVTDWVAKNNFVKYVLSGMLITVCMTGLDQDMMQKNLTCRTLQKAQKNMYSYGFMFLPINFAFLLLGLYVGSIFIESGITIPGKNDMLLPEAVRMGLLPEAATYIFIIGIISASLSSADSTFVSLTTTISTTFCPSQTKEDKGKYENFRKLTHIAVGTFFCLMLMVFYFVKNNNMIDLLFRLASYTYGPLLGLFTLSMFTKIKIKDKISPLVCTISPIICVIIQVLSSNSLGYELLLLNGFITFVGLMLIKQK